MLKEGAVKLQPLHDTQQGATSNVIPLVDATRSRPSGRVPVESRARREARSDVGYEVKRRRQKGKSWWAGTGLNR